MRRARARPRRGLVRVLPQRAVLAGLRHDGIRVVPIAELDRRLVDDRHQVLLAERGIEPEDVPRVGLLDRELGDRPALGVVGREQAGTGLAAQDGRELPGQVVGVVDAGVAAEAAGRGHHVGRVAREEGPPLLEPLGPVGHRAPALDVLDLHVDVRIAERAPHVLDAARLARVLPGLVLRTPSSSTVELTTRNPASPASENRKNPVSRGWNT